MEDRRTWQAGCLFDVAPSRHLGMECLCSTFVSTEGEEISWASAETQLLSLLHYQVLKGPMVSSGCYMPPWVWQKDPKWEKEVAFCFATQLSWKGLRHHVDQLCVPVAVIRLQVSAWEGISALESSCNADYCRRNHQVVFRSCAYVDQLHRAGILRIKLKSEFISLIWMYVGIWFEK